MDKQKKYNNFMILGSLISFISAGIVGYIIWNLWGLIAAILAFVICLSLIFSIVTRVAKTKFGKSFVKQQELIEELKSKNGKIQLEASNSLDKMGWTPSSDDEKAYYLIAKEDWNGLVKLGKPAVESIIKVLKNKDENIRCSLVTALGETGDIKVAEILIPALKDEKTLVRKEATKALDKITWNPNNDVEKVHYLIAKEDWNGLVDLGKPAVKPIRKVLKNKDENIRCSLVMALGETGDIKMAELLITALKDEKTFVRRKATKALDKIGWNPINDVEKIHYLIAKEDRNGLVDLGKPAVKPLISNLRNNDNIENVVCVIEALGKIGDIEAIEAISLCTYKDGFEPDLNYKKKIIPVIAKALINMGEPAITKLSKLLNKNNTLNGSALAWALCEIGNNKTKETVVNWIFHTGQFKPILVTNRGDITPIIYQGKLLSPPDVIRLLIPPEILPKFLGDYTSLMLDIFNWKCYLHSSGQPKFDLSTCNEALQIICKINTPISNNILHKVSEIEKINLISQQTSSIQTITEYVDFKSTQQIAKNELKRRGNPKYDSSVYLNERDWKLSENQKA